MWLLELVVRWFYVSHIQPLRVAFRWADLYLSRRIFAWRNEHKSSLLWRTRHPSDNSCAGFRWRRWRWNLLIVTPEVSHIYVLCTSTTFLASFFEPGVSMQHFLCLYRFLGRISLFSLSRRDSWPVKLPPVQRSSPFILPCLWFNVCCSLQIWLMRIHLLQRMGASLCCHSSIASLRQDHGFRLSLGVCIHCTEELHWLHIRREQSFWTSVFPTSVSPSSTGHWNLPTSYSLFPSNTFQKFDKHSLLTSRRTKELITLFL